MSKMWILAGVVIVILIVVLVLLFVLPTEDPETGEQTSVMNIFIKSLTGATKGPVAPLAFPNTPKAVTTTKAPVVTTQDNTQLPNEFVIETKDMMTVETEDNTENTIEVRV